MKHIDTRESLEFSGDNVTYPVDLIRTLAVFLFILLDASLFPYSTLQGINANWWTVNIYDALGRVGIPLLVMVTGALLLEPQMAKEPLSVFFKKRLIRIVLPLVFWSLVYFAWRFFINHEALSANSVFDGILGGAYYHFWFVYLLIGLYLVTPVLRVVVAYVDRKSFTYLMLLWFIGTIIVWVSNSFGSLGFFRVVFIFSGWIGYFLLGVWLQKVKVNKRLLIGIVLFGFGVAVVGTYFVTAFVGESLVNIFHDPLSFSMILASTALFLLLCSVSPKQFESRLPKASSVTHWISKNALPIYLFHVIVLETLQLGLLGLTINMNTLNPLLEIPLITIITLAVSVAVIYLLKKIPIVKDVIG